MRSLLRALPLRYILPLDRKATMGHRVTEHQVPRAAFFQIHLERDGLARFGRPPKLLLQRRTSQIRIDLPQHSAHRSVAVSARENAVRRIIDELEAPVLVQHDERIRDAFDDAPGKTLCSLG